MFLRVGAAKSYCERGFPSQVKGVGLRLLCRRTSWVRIPLPAPPTPTDAGGLGSAGSASAKGGVPVPAIQRERILQHVWHLKKNGYRESTITGRVKLHRSLARRVNLFNPEAIKGTMLSSMSRNGGSRCYPAATSVSVDSSTSPCQS